MSRGRKIEERKHIPFVRKQPAALGEGSGALQFTVNADPGTAQAGIAVDPQKGGSAASCLRHRCLHGLGISSERGGLAQANGEPTAYPKDPPDHGVGQFLAVGIRWARSFRQPGRTVWQAVPP